MCSVSENVSQLIYKWLDSWYLQQCMRTFIYIHCKETILKEGKQAEVPNNTRTGLKISANSASHQLINLIVKFDFSQLYWESYQNWWNYESGKVWSGFDPI